MFCKSGILIFLFAENNYSIYAHAMLIKTPLLHQSFDPCVCLFFLSLSLSFSSFLFFSFSISLFLANSLECGGPLSSLSCPGFSAPLEKAQCAFTHSRGRPVPTCSSASPKNRVLLAFRVNQGISASFSLLLSYHQLWATRFQSRTTYFTVTENLPCTIHGNQELNIVTIFPLCYIKHSQITQEHQSTWEELVLYEIKLTCVMTFINPMR